MIIMYRYIQIRKGRLKYNSDNNMENATRFYYRSFHHEDLKR